MIETFYTIGRIFGTIIPWFSILYSVWFFIKEDKIIWKISGLFLFVILINVPGYVSVFLAIIIYLTMSIFFQPKNDKKTKISSQISKNKIYIITLVVILFIFSIQSFIHGFFIGSNSDEIYLMFEKQNQLLEKSVAIYKTFEQEENQLELYSIADDYAQLGYEYKQASDECVAKINMLENNSPMKKETEFRIEYLNLFKNIFDSGYGSANNMQLAVDSYASGKYELYESHLNKAIEYDEMHDLYVENLNEYLNTETEYLGE